MELESRYYARLEEIATNGRTFTGKTPRRRDGEAAERLRAAGLRRVAGEDTSSLVRRDRENHRLRLHTGRAVEIFQHRAPQEWKPNPRHWWGV